LLSAISYGLQVADLSIGRLPDGSTNWGLANPTPQAPNLAVPSLGDPAQLKVNEWMAAPASGEDWFEIYNPNTHPVALGGLHLTDDLNRPTKHRIAALSFVGTGTNALQQFVADSATGAGADHVNFALRAAGEDIGIAATNGALIDGVRFQDQREGLSEGRFPDGHAEVIGFPGTASPGESNYRWLSEVAISEVLTHTDPPLEDAIELQNLTDHPIDVGGWWLSDDKTALQKYRIPSPTVLPARGFAVIYESQFTNRELANLPFALSSKGDEVVLSAATNNGLTGFRAFVDFGAADNAISLGRYLTRDGRTEFVALAARTFGVDDPGSVEEFRQGAGASNAPPRVGPIVISGIMYHPPDLGTNENTQAEFIDLRNITTAPVPLFDTNQPPNVWHLRDAVDFDFPPGLTVPAGGHVLVVSFDPVNNPSALTAFRAKYQLQPGLPIVGPYIGKLANDTDEIELRRPGEPDLEDVPYVLVERVKYADRAPWPPEADGSGFSLQRMDDRLYGNDPFNWTAAAPTPGPPTGSQDTDGDGMPDAWETAYGFDPFNPQDAALDSDNDGLTNLQEFHAGTYPRETQSALRFEAIGAGQGSTNLVLTFTAVSNRTYSIESAAALANTTWVGVSDLDAAPTNRLIRLLVPITERARFYRLRTPWLRDVTPTGLRIQSIQAAPQNGAVLLRVEVAAGLSCVVEQSRWLASGPWSTVTNYPAAPTLRVIEVVTPAGGGSGFYRLRSPAP
jgi:hypothetical protein